MAGLAVGSFPRESKQRISAREQLLAVAWLRWRIFVNGGFRRRPKTGRQAVGLIFAILLRVVVWPIFALMAVGPVVGSGFLAWEAIAENHPKNLVTLLAGVTLLWQFVSINGMNIAAAVSSFDPSSLIRFPLGFGRYLVLRTFFGLLTPSTIVGCLALMAAAAGIAFADPRLALPALIVMATYALMNIYLTRMIEVWVERWFANRRVREVFGALMALMAVGVQFLNFQRASVRDDGTTNNWLLGFLHGSHAYLNWLPPGFAANAILAAGHPIWRFVQFAGLLGSTVVCGAIFAVRLHKQYLGEYLSENTGKREAGKPAKRARAHSRIEEVGARAALPEWAGRAFPSTVGACLRKEWLIMRGNGSQFIALLTPLIFIVILNRTGFAQRSSYFLPGAIAYALVTVLAGLYNIFGADGLGVQLYLLAPVRMRDVLIAKNLASLIVILIQASLAWILAITLAHNPIPLPTQVATALWTGFVIAVNLAIGTVRSIQSPRRFVPGQARQQRSTPTGRTNSLLILVVLFGSLALQVPVVLLCKYLQRPWLAAFVFGPLAALALLAYALVLRNAERLVLSHRDVLTEELCKV
jgi:ABC-2 type transport system permease protein